MKGIIHINRIALAACALVTHLMASGAAHAVDLAKVNGRIITDKDLINTLGSLNEGQRESLLKDVNSRRQVLNGAIEQQLLVEEAEKQKLDQDQEYKEAINAFRRQYLASRVLQRNLGAKFGEKDSKKYYEAHVKRYSTEQAHVLHILAREEADAKEILKKAKSANDDEFKDLAEKLSKDTSAKNNRGDLGFITHDRMATEFTDAAFDAAEGEVVGPVRTAFGYHIIKVIKKKPGKPLEFDEVVLRVKSDLRDSLTRNYVSSLRKQAKVEIDDKAVDKL